MSRDLVVLTLDAGGTNFSFSAIKNAKLIGKSFSLSSNAHDLDLCLQSMKNGFGRLIEELDERADAISFAFPGPADYRSGVIAGLPNLPAFYDSIALGPYLEKEFGLPVFINNDGNLFALGESEYGFLPYINGLLAQAGNPRRYQNLIGVTLGTGFGAGVVIRGTLLEGDNNAGAEVWKMRNKRHSYTSVEDTVSIRSLKRIYAEQISVDPAKAPEPKEIFEIAMGRKEGVREAAVESYLRYGEVIGDAIAHINTIIDGLIVVGGGVSGAYSLFSRSLFDELNSSFTMLNGSKHRRLIQRVLDLENDYQRNEFLKDESGEVIIPHSTEKVIWQKEKKSGVGLSRLGTSQAIALGAYHFAKERLG